MARERKRLDGWRCVVLGFRDG